MVLLARDLIEKPEKVRPHMVILGAGASLAALPEGDVNGKKLPLMNSLISTIELEPLLESVPSVAGMANFEEVYSALVEDGRYDDIREEIERRVRLYFSWMELPTNATIYDALILSLNSNDAIFTFNWDPLLFDAWERNRHVAPSPQVFFLHGNVRIEFCQKDMRYLKVGTLCPTCGRRGESLPLLYPTAKKSYSEDKGIAAAWHAAANYIKECMTLTIFGYGAPTTDVDAVSLLKNAWFSRSTRRIEHLQIVNVDDPSALCERWKEFAPTGHLDVVKDFYDCYLAQWPRRSIQALFYPMSTGLPAEQFPIPRTSDLGDLQSFVRGIAQHETKA